MDLHAIGRWPGKSPIAPGGAEHPALYHMLDVAAVAERLLAPLDLPPARRSLLCGLVALHDLGKVGGQFRAMIRTGAPQAGGRHWEVTEAWLREKGNNAWLQDRLGCDRFSLYPLIGAVAGHHGRPPRGVIPDDLDRMRRNAGPEAAVDARAALEAVLSLWPDARLDLGDQEAQTLSWWLAGLTTAADWVGSNADWFPPRPPILALADYLERARDLAAAAVAAAGLAPSAPKDGTLFPFAPRPMQAAAAALALREGPMLAVLEDETGSGKTEAALILAQRMLLAGKGRGLYVALPTMATADAMFLRLRDVAGLLFDKPSLTLAHGRSGLSREFRDLVGREGDSDSPTCAPWLADGRRRALLADVGVGTIDQALLAVLPTRFSTLRAWGLSSKILLVDEVHELGEPYVGEVLATLLRLHARLGGSAILLTATLPLDLRARLVAAFEDGAGRQAKADHDPAYPSLKIAGGAAVRDLPVVASPKGPVRVRRLATAEEAADLIAEAARGGAACAWVRNAVDDAAAAVGLLRARGIEAELLHARFALGDRKRIEAGVVGRFGKAGTGREGQVVVASQIIQASLDLDFDVMVSDLAPMADLIQRAGRLWRHMALRPKGDRPVPEPILHVLSPDPAVVEDAQWLHGTLDRGVWVYALDDQWRTADALFRAGEIVAPTGLRALIEAVHGEGAASVPAPLERAEVERVGGDMAKANLASQNVVRLDDGYRDGGGGFDDRQYPTRLGEEQRLLALARDDGEALRPWGEGWGAEGWMLSEVQVAERRLRGLALPDQGDPRVVAAKAGWPAWKGERVTLCPVGGDGAICDGLRYDARLGLMFGSPPEQG